MICGKLFVFFVIAVGLTLAYAPGEYIPKSFYLIDQFGHESAPIYIRNRRELLNPLIRVRRGNSYTSSSSSASASSGANSGGGAPIYLGDYAPNVEHPSDIIGHVQSLLNNIPGGAGGAGTHSFASSSSSSNAGNGGHPASGGSYGGLGAGHDAGYTGPVLFSRFGEAEGTGVQVSGAAQGNKGAFSSSSSSIDGNGKIKYSVQSGKY
ncbi:unnamed protein product [Ceutorhynchus assimilis]|uniref:Uncharacterized protein n=1 Tax=Ceutorhynchus assimilis TaxID=467358 RepID=A0A9N9MXY1_9CUCU|nr:unnamed protein product [Ceutorhynchus assimilis]